MVSTDSTRRLIWPNISTTITTTMISTCIMMYTTVSTRRVRTVHVKHSTGRVRSVQITYGHYT